jgi:acetyl-CoA acetyltransferase
VRNGAAIVGAALSDIGRVDDRSAWELHQQAAARAIADAGLEPADIDGFGGGALGNLGPIEMAEYLGIKPRWADSTMTGGSMWVFQLQHAVDAIRAGHAETVLLVYAATARADLKGGRRATSNLSFGNRGPVQFDAPFGHSLIAKYAMAATRHMHEFGTTVDQLAEIAVSARFNASHNPDAYYRDLITRDDVHNSRMMSTPLTKLHCCIRSDGGGAIVVTSAARAKDCATAPVWVLGTGQATSHTTMTDWDDFTASPAVVSGAQAFAEAGVTPSDVDVCEIYDAFTPMVLLSLEALGFCNRGEGGPFVESGALRLGGELPTNTDGGGLSHCHPGMRSMFLLVEAVRQLRGEAVGRQVANARVACVNGTGGWWSSAATAILGVD